MNPAARFVWSVLPFAIAAPALGRTAASNRPPDVQHFGPLAVVAFQVTSPDPDVLRSDIFSQTKPERLRFLHAIGVETTPELNQMWQEFLTDHVGKEDEAITQFASGGLLDIRIGEPAAKQIEASITFDASQDKPLEFTALFNWADGRWTHVATLACRCQMSDMEEPVNLHSYKAHPPGEWAITLWSHSSDDVDAHSREIRFRLRSGALWPLIDFDSRWDHCPSSYHPGTKCLMNSSTLQKAKLMSEAGDLVPGFVVITYSGMVSTDVKVPMLGNARCVSYTWSEIHFSYEPSHLKPATCGEPLAPTAQRIQTHSTPTPAIPAPK